MGNNNNKGKDLLFWIIYSLVSDVKESMDNYAENLKRDYTGMRRSNYDSKNDIF